MAATRSDIIYWIESRPEGTTHMAITCDGFGDPFDSDCCGPEYIIADSIGDTRSKVSSLSNRLMEVYSFTENHTIEEQMAERRAFHYD